MGERKVLNKYYPPDFDPAKIPRRKQPKNLQTKVRSMLPMSIQCNTCGNYIYKGTKFNFRKENVKGETYLGIQIFRLYFKCSKCSAELSVKTDPQNDDYIVEAGASRNYEPWRAIDEATNEVLKKRKAEELGDTMKALENRTLDSKQEMDNMVALDELKSMRSRQANIGVGKMMAALCYTTVEKNSRKFVQHIDDAKVKEFYLDQESALPFETLKERDLLKKGKIEAKPLVNSSIRKIQMAKVHASDMPKLEAKSSNGSRKAPSFIVHMKPIAFNTKPKKVFFPRSTKQLIRDALGDQSILVPKVSIKEADSQSDNVVTSLALAYGSDNDFE